MSPAAVINTATEQAQKVAEALEKSAKASQQAATETAKEASNRVVAALNTWIDLNRKITLAGLGAAALINDEFSTISARCIERGEQVEKDVKAYTETQVEALKKLLPKFPAPAAAVEQGAADTSGEAEAAAEDQACEGCADEAA